MKIHTHSHLPLFASLGLAAQLSPAALSAQVNHEHYKPITLPSQTGSSSALSSPGGREPLLRGRASAFIGLELWLVLAQQAQRSRKANHLLAALQEVTSPSMAAYDPQGHIGCRAGRGWRLNFYRKDPSSCLEEVAASRNFRTLPQALPSNQDDGDSSSRLPSPVATSLPAAMNIWFRGQPSIVVAETETQFPLEAIAEPTAPQHYPPLPPTVGPDLLSRGNGGDDHP